MVLVLALFLCAATSVFAQMPSVQQRLFEPATMTNRQLSFFGDASAVGWNPSLLGTRPTLDVVAATSLDDQFALSGQYGVFVRMLGFAAGYVANTGNFATGELYAGLGLNIIDDVLWFGASGRMVNPGELRNVDWSATRYNASLLIKPINGLYLTGGAKTMGLDTWRNEGIQGATTFNHIRSSPDSLVVYAGATYSPLNWISLFVHYTTPPLLVRGAAPATQSTNFGLDVGASVTLFNDVLILSGNYNVPAQTVRVGAEANIGALGVGLFRAMPQNGAANHVAIARFSNDQARNTSALLGVRTDDDGCRVPVDTMLQSPEYLLSTLKRDNPILYDTLTMLTNAAQQPPSALYRTIRERFYKPKQAAQSLAGDTIDIVSKQGYALQTLDVDNAAFPEVSVVVRAIDTATGGTVAGLGMNDFSFRDPKNMLVSVKPTDTTASVPLDVVIIIDCSSSMQNKIDETRANARKFAEALRKKGVDYRLGGILYGLSVVRVLQPTADFDKFQAFVDKAKATEPDEYAPEAFETLLRMKFRPDAERIAILISDEVTYTGGYRHAVETDIVRRLWQQRITMHKIIKPCDNNGSATALVTLGQEFNIKDSFERILGTIGSQLTTTYTITYRRNEPKISAVTGSITSSDGEPLAATVTFKDTLANSVGPVATEPTTGRFTTPIAEGKRYTMRVEPNDTSNYEPVLQSVNLSTLKRGDTVRLRDVVVKRVVKPVWLRGKVQNPEQQPLPAELFLTELDMAGNTLESETVATDAVKAEYERKYAEGKAFTVFVDAADEALRDEYVPQASDMNFRSARQGDTVVYNFTLSRYPKKLVLAGRVTATQPVAQGLGDVDVSATDVATNTTIAQTRTDATGDYRLTLPKGKTYSIAFKTADYYSDSALVKLPKRDTATTQALPTPPLVWKNVLVRGNVEAATTGVPVASAVVIAQRDSTTQLLTQATTLADGTYQMRVPKETPLRFTAQSSEYFFASSTAYFTKQDTAVVVQNFRLPEELSLRLNFPVDDYRNPTPFVLDSNGLPSTVRWQDELDRVANNLLLFKQFIAKLTIIGHTDDTADEAYNRKLGQNRAEFVVGELVKRGVPREILEAKSEGEQRLLPRRANEPQDLWRARCRRVELVKTKR